nr:amidohydrolase family protein [Pseudonocardia sp. EC080610-09]
MHADTAAAAAALVLGGVLERHPRLRVALAHGCGSLPWTYSRLRYAVTSIAGTHAPEHLDALLARLWCDTLVFDPQHLALLAARFGAGHLLLGSDHPFYPSPLGELVGIAEQAEAAGALRPEAAVAVAERNAVEFLGAHRLPVAPRT